VPDDSVSAADLIAVLERFQLRPAAVAAVPIAAQGQVELACARIAALTELLRRDAAWSDASRLTARLLLADLGAVSAQFRAGANESAAALTQVTDSIRTLLERTAS
jgi:hypothetical protein